ncbi:MAG: leukotoxin LktA family filamentous adhesin, partial [Pyramidobacter sp.]|nr:leukotoxin LktA family filamentous adhesin [Pyramidobacter sp.]
MAQKKRERIKDRRLNTADKIIAATLAASTILSPISAVATELTVHESYNGKTTVTPSADGKKFTVTTNKTNGGSAFNRFSKFKLDENHIANMVLPGKTTKLYNFVDGPDKIDIKGTVNALQEHARKIGGHLIFISPKGMIIGPQGAINAGKFSAIIADDKTYNAITSGDAPWKRTEFQRMEAGYVALNPEGSIVVQGKITAPDGIELKAAQVKTEAGSKLDTKTTQLDISQLVNIQDSSVDVNQDSLKIERTENGDVRLVAIGVPSGDKSEALIEHAGSIDAAGSVIMHAQAAGSEYSIESAAAGQSPFSSAGVKNKVAVKAKVAVKQGATVSSDNNIVVSADVWSFRVDPAFASGIVSIDQTIFPTLSNEKFDGSYTDLSTEAEIEIEHGAKLAASGDLTLHADSTVGVIAGKSAGFLDLINWPTGNQNNKIPAAGVVVSKQSGSAKVTVSGDLRAGGEVKIGALAALTTELNAIATSHDQNMPPVALLWAELENNAAVTIDASADIKAGGALAIDSSVTNSITTQASSKATGNVPGGTALNATIVATGAQTMVGANLSADGAVTITATDTTDTWSVSANNRTSTAELYKQVLPTKVTPVTFKKIYKHLQDKVELADMYRYGGADDEDYEKSADKWGFSVLYTGVRSTDTPTQLSSVAIGPGVSIVAPGDITINSEAVVEDHHWVTRSEVGGSGFDEGDLEDTFSYAVTYGSPMMASAVNVTPLANLTSTAGSIDIRSSARVEWNRVGRIIGKLKADWNGIVGTFKNSDAWAQAAQIISSDVFKAPSIKNWAGFKTYAQNIGIVLLKTAGYMTTTQFASLIPDLMSFADLSSYANVYSQSMAATSEGGQYSSFENKGSGSFAWPNWILSNTLDIHPGAALTAKGSLNVSGSTRSDMALLGGINNNILGGDIANVRSHDVAVGGTFMIDTFTTENNVNIHRGAALLSSADITAAADDSSMQLVVNLLGAKPGEKGIDGQMNVLVHSLAGRVNIDDEVTLSAPVLTIKSEASNYVTNIALAYQSKLKSFGFAAGIDVLNYENTALVADFDEAFSDDTSTEVPAAYIAADSINVGAFTHAHVNTIAAAGSGAYTPASGDGTHWYDTLNKIPDLPLKGSKKLSEWVGSKITGTATRQQQAEDGEGGTGSSGAGGSTSSDQESAPERTNIEDAANAGLNQASPDIIDHIVGTVSSDRSTVLDAASSDDEEEREQHTLNLAVAGSVAWNFADYTTHAGLQGGESNTLTIKSYAESETGNTSNRAIMIESQADKWQAAFTGAVAVSLVNDQEEEDVKSVGVAGAVSVNSGKSIVSADLGNATLVSLKNADRDAVAVTAGSTGRSVAAALGFDLSEGSEESDVSVA